MNKYGYAAQFNLYDNNKGKISTLTWDNPELYYKNVNVHLIMSMIFNNANAIHPIQ